MTFSSNKFKTVNKLFPFYHANCRQQNSLTDSNTKNGLSRIIFSGELPVPSSDLILNIFSVTVLSCLKQHK